VFLHRVLEPVASIILVLAILHRVGNRLLGRPHHIFEIVMVGSICHASSLRSREGRGGIYDEVKQTLTVALWQSEQQSQGTAISIAIAHPAS
jgi:hypothetical protein